MKIGVLLFPTHTPVDIAVVARKAEELGFDSLWLGEHPIMPEQGALAELEEIAQQVL